MEVGLFFPLVQNFGEKALQQTAAWRTKKAPAGNHTNRVYENLLPFPVFGRIRILPKD